MRGKATADTGTFCISWCRLANRPRRPAVGRDACCAMSRSPQWSLHIRCWNCGAASQQHHSL